MIVRGKFLTTLMFCAASILSGCVAPDDDDRLVDADRPPQPDAKLAVEQRQSVGIMIAHPRAAKLPDSIPSVGIVLDTAELISEVGDMAALEAARRTSQAEVARLQTLYTAGAGASLRMLEAATAENTKAVAQAHLMRVRFDQHWGPVAKLPATKRRRLLDAAANGQILLMRADVPGRHSLGALPEGAKVDVDGLSVPGSVLGVLRQADETQGMGLLIGVEHSPAGLGPGARVPVALICGQRSGLLLPQEALLYDEQGPYVFRELNDIPIGHAEQGRSRYTRANVKLLLRHGDHWLVNGIDDGDNIVVAGAGALWSLQGTEGRGTDDDD